MTERQKNFKLPSPVALNSIESFHADAGTAAHPNVMVGRVSYDGFVDVDLARQAWYFCLSRQQFALWKAVCENGRWSLRDINGPEEVEALLDASFQVVDVDRWEEDPLERKVPCINEIGVPDFHIGTGAPYGLYCIRSQKDNKTEVFLTAQHALADGLASISFVRQWMQCYDNLVGGRPLEKGLPTLDFERWLNRDHLGLLSWKYLKLIPVQVVGLFGATKFVFRKFCIFGRTKIEPRGIAVSPGVIGKCIEADEYQRLKNLARDNDVSENSVVIAILFRMLESARTSDRFSVNDAKWLRLILPMNVREYADRRIPSANRTSIVQLDRRDCISCEFLDLAKTVNHEVEVIANWKLDRVFLIALRVASLSKSWLKRIASNQKSRGSAVFANLAEPFKSSRHCDFVRVGNLVRTSFDLSGPIRAGTPLNFSWQRFRTSDGQIVGRVTLHFDQAVVSKADAEWVLSQFKVPG